MEDQHQPDNIFNVSIDLEAKEHLRMAALWAKIIAVIAFISAGVSLLSSFLGNKSGVQMIGSFFGSLVGVTISVIVNIFLYRFASKTIQGLVGNNQQEFSAGIDNLRNYFKIIGIILIIALSLIALLFIFLIIGTSVGR
jgi:hypothetical protein